MDQNAAIRRIRNIEHEATTRVWMRSWESADVGHPNDLPFEQLLQLFKHDLENQWDFYVADLNGQVVGLLALKLQTKQLDQLFVDPKFQGRGVGRTMLEFAKDRLPDGMWLRTPERNLKAIDFYKSAGFTFDKLEPRPEWDRNDILLEWTPTA